MKLFRSMIVNITNEFKLLLIEQVSYIYRDKPKAALKFRKDLIKNLKKDLINSFHFKNLFISMRKTFEIIFSKVITSVYEIDIENDTVSVFGFVKHKYSI